MVERRRQITAYKGGFVKLSHFTYVCREAVIGKFLSLHAVIEMVDSTHQSRLAGEGFKPPKGVLVKS